MDPTRHDLQGFEVGRPFRRPSVRTGNPRSQTRHPDAPGQISKTPRAGLRPSTTGPSKDPGPCPRLPEPEPRVPSPPDLTSDPTTAGGAGRDTRDTHELVVGRKREDLLQGVHRDGSHTDNTGHTGDQSPPTRLSLLNMTRDPNSLVPRTSVSSGLRYRAGQGHRRRPDHPFRGLRSVVRERVVTPTSGCQD